MIPHEEVIGQGSVMVSFGLPLPPGFVLDARQIAVHDDKGKEIPAYTRSVGLWRSMPPAKLLCAGLVPLDNPGNPGVRSVLVQFSRNFPTADPAIVTVELNSARTKNLEAETPIRDTGRLAAEGTYRSADDIREPRVYTLLPPHWLACSNLTTMATVAGEHELLAKSDKGQVDFFDTVINNFNPNPSPDRLVDFHKDYEPWLYDRAQTFRLCAYGAGGVPARGA